MASHLSSLPPPLQVNNVSHLVELRDKMIGEHPGMEMDMMVCVDGREGGGEGGHGVWRPHRESRGNARHCGTSGGEGRGEEEGGR